MLGFCLAGASVTLDLTGTAVLGPDAVTGVWGCALPDFGMMVDGERWAATPQRAVTPRRAATPQRAVTSRWAATPQRAVVKE